MKGWGGLLGLFDVGIILSADAPASSRISSIVESRRRVRRPRDDLAGRGVSGRDGRAGQRGGPPQRRGESPLGHAWNPPGLFRTVYLSLEMSTAVEEFLAQNRRLGLPDAQSLPLVITASRAVVPRLLDLTLGKVRSILRVSEARMVSEPHGLGPESITQAIGRIAHSEGLQGLLVPSAAVPGEKNLVVFPELLPPGHLVPMNPGRLPPKTRGR